MSSEVGTVYVLLDAGVRVITTSRETREQWLGHQVNPIGKFVSFNLYTVVSPFFFKIYFSLCFIFSVGISKALVSN